MIIKSMFAVSVFTLIVSFIVLATLGLPIVIVGIVLWLCAVQIWRRWNALVAWYTRLYCDELWRARHKLEEEARALGALRLPEWPT